MPTVSIIIPNWNGMAHLPDCLDSIGVQTMEPMETIIVDNGSSDGSVEFVKTHYPWAVVIPLPSNAGVGIALNRGISESRGEYLALLNNDIALSPQWLETMVTALQSEAQAGSVACKMLKFYERNRIDAAGDFLTRAGAPFARGFNEPDNGEYDTRGFVFGACGGAALYRRAMLEEIGVFDEDFVSFFEDVDLAFRAQLAGYKCLYVPTAVCYHKRGATFRTRSGYEIRMMQRNLTSLYVKNFPAWLLLTKMPLILASRGRQLYRSVSGGGLISAVTGMWEGFLLVPAMLRKRGAIQGKRRVSLQYIRTFMRSLS